MGSMEEQKDELLQLATHLHEPGSGLEVKHRKYLLSTYPNCFLGSQALDCIMKHKQCPRGIALAIGNDLIRAGLIRHVVDPEKPLLDGYFFYQFTSKIKKKTKLRTSTEIPSTTKDVARMMMDRTNGLQVKDRRSFLKTYPNCFVASEAVDWMLRHLALRTRAEAVALGKRLVDEGFVEHVAEPQSFKDQNLFFRFTRYVQLNQSAVLAQNPEEETIVGRDEFQHIKVVGEGGYGRVVLVKKLDTGKYYAMKILDKHKIKTERSLEHIVTERKVLINDSPFLLHLHFSFQDKHKLYLVTDFLAGGDLFHHLSRRKHRGFHPRVVHFFVAELVLALEHLHQCGVIYRDMKLENVLLDEQGHICLADFGLSKELQDGTDRTQTFCGSQGYLAPEILRAEPYSFEVDWFSLGVIMYELLSSQNPFLGENFRETCRNILTRNVTYPPYFPRGAVELLQMLLSKDPARRIRSAAQIKRHPWYRELDWNSLSLKKIVPPFRINVRSIESAEHFDEHFTKIKILEDSDVESEGQAPNQLFDNFDYSFPRV